MSPHPPRRPRPSGASHSSSHLSRTSEAAPARRASGPARASSDTPPAAFAALGLLPTLVRALGDEGYEHPTPIQAQAIGPALEGSDLLACAQTGTGKTAAFVLPILQRLSGHAGQGRIRSLVLTPTRELASQIAERASAYGHYLQLRQTVIFGGVGQQRQEQALRGRLDLVVATPGRLIDLMQQRFVNLSGVEIFVLDEADRMLDMGFLPDVRRIISALPTVRQTLFFSATMPPAISGLAAGILKNPVRIAIAPAVTTAATVEQVLYHVPKAQKTALLERLLEGPEMTRTIVFTRTKRGADRLFTQLTRGGFDAAVIHGNKSQGARERALGGFRGGHTRVLIATDIAARGIDVDGISHVVNFDLPDVAESYVHRIGRTGRAGASGSAITFCDPAERALLRDVERFIRQPIPLAPGQVAPTGPVPPPEGRSGGGRPKQGGRPPRTHRSKGGGSARRRPAGVRSW
jgi:ATP-dependent RNA helicase RhlE